MVSNSNVCPQVNKSEQVSAEDHQMSVAGGGWWVSMKHVTYLSPTPRGQNK